MIYQDHGHLIADSMEDLTSEGWKILLDEPWKEGVRMVHATRTTFGINAQFIIVYVKVQACQSA